MGFYSNRVLPRLVHWTMRDGRFEPYRQRVVSAATGRVLEIGVGSGLNLPFYSTGAREIIGLELLPRLAEMTRRKAGESGLSATIVEGSAEAIPLESASIDTVVMTWVLCSIADAIKALGEMRRVLVPGGRLLFVEHGLAPEAGVRKWQRRLTPLWKPLAGGCHLDRAIDSLIEAGGFQIERLETGYMRGMKTIAFNYEGSARPR